MDGLEIAAVLGVSAVGLTLAHKYNAIPQVFNNPSQKWFWEYFTPQATARTPISSQGQTSISYAAITERNEAIRKKEADARLFVGKYQLTAVESQPLIPQKFSVGIGSGGY